MTTTLHAALAYASRGYRVLPLEANGKRPLTDHGVHSSTLGQLAIHNLFSQPCNLGLAIPDDVVVLDVDVRNDGPATLRKYLAHWGRLPTTPHQLTASGGDHFVFRRPTHAPNLRTKLGPGVELLGRGRYIVAAPSTIHGKPYRWTQKLSSTPIADLPMWLLDLALYDPPSAETVQASAPSPQDVVERARKYVRNIPPAVSGQGGSRDTFLLAQRLVRGFQLTDAEALDVLDAWNQGCAPPWSHRELARKVREARAKGTMAFGELLNAERRAS